MQEPSQKNAPILILDDSVSAVDVKTEEKILHNLTDERKEMTTIVIASRISTVSHLDRIIVLDEGKLEAFDTHANLMKISPFYKRMVHLQELEKRRGRRPIRCPILKKMSLSKVTKDTFKNSF